jgi:membrane protein implicated in regulation of membrane protease activity
MRALKTGAAFAVIAIVLLLVIQPAYFLGIAAALAVFEVLSYTYFTKRYTKTRDDLLAAYDKRPQELS